MPFILVHARKYRTKDRLKIQTIYKLNETYKKQTMQNAAEQNYPGLLAFHHCQPENEVAYSTTLTSPHGEKPPG